MDVIERMLLAGADCEIKDSDGCTPFYCSVMASRSVSVGALIQCGADILAEDHELCTVFDHPLTEENIASVAPHMLAEVNAMVTAPTNIQRPKAETGSRLKLRTTPAARVRKTQNGHTLPPSVFSVFHRDSNPSDVLPLSDKLTNALTTSGVFEIPFPAHVVGEAEDENEYGNEATPPPRPVLVVAAEAGNTTAATVVLKLTRGAGMRPPRWAMQGGGIPAYLQGAYDELCSLDRGNVYAVKSYRKPPESIRLVLEAVCVMMGIAPIECRACMKMKRAVCPHRNHMYWRRSQELLGSRDFGARLATLHLHFKQKHMALFRDKYLHHPNFQGKPPKKNLKAKYRALIGKSEIRRQKASGALRRWLIAIEKFDRLHLQGTRLDKDTDDTDEETDQSDSAGKNKKKASKKI